MGIVAESHDPEHIRKKYNASVLRMRVNDCTSLEELFDVIKTIEQMAKSGDIYKYAYSCLRDEVLKKLKSLMNSDSKED